MWSDLIQSVHLRVGIFKFSLLIMIIVNIDPGLSMYQTLCFHVLMLVRNHQKSDLEGAWAILVEGVLTQVRGNKYSAIHQLWGLEWAMPFPRPVSYSVRWWDRWHDEWVSASTPTLHQLSGALCGARLWASVGECHDPSAMSATLSGGAGGRPVAHLPPLAKALLRSFPAQILEFTVPAQLSY